MQLKILLLLVVLSISLKESKADTIFGRMVAFAINVGLKMILNNLQRTQDVTLISSRYFSIPTGWNDFAIGSLKLENTKIQDLRTMHINNYLVKDLSKLENTSKTSISVDLTLDKLELSTNYDVDIGILNEIPVYGDGEVKLALSEVNVTVNVNLFLSKDFSKKNISDLDIQLYIRDSPSFITGFWKNEKASNILTGAINILEKQFCMWFDYERKSINTALSKILEFVINSLLSKKKIAHSEYNSLMGGKYNLLENLEIMTQFYENGTFPQYFSSSMAKRDMKLLCMDISQAIIGTLQANGVMKEFV